MENVPQRVGACLIERDALDRQGTPGELAQLQVDGDVIGAGMRSQVDAALCDAGAAMLVLPGQGLLTLVIGLSLMNFPGKRRLIIRILRRPRVFRTINTMRDKARRPPLQWPPDES